MSKVKLTITFLTAILIGFMLFLFVDQVKDWIRADQQNDLRGDVIKTTAGNIQDVQTTNRQRATADGVIQQARADYKQKLDEALTYDPALRDRNDRPVPSVLRELARQRRLARERFGCPDARCPDSSTAETVE